MYEQLYKKMTSSASRAAYLETVDYVKRDSLLMDPERPGKLNGVSVLVLSKNCGRAAWINRAKDFAWIPENVDVCSCYGGKCWQEFTVANRFGKKRADVDTIADYRAQVVDASSIAALVKPGKKAFRVTFMYREGQAGDSSHAFIGQQGGKSAAVAWLEALEAAGITTKTVFITAGYAPVTMEEFKALEKYKNRFVLHFSLSGWFTRGEIDCRLAMMEAARAAGLDPFVRIVTNRDNISGVKMENESYLFQQLEALQVSRDRILETPFHDDENGHIRSRAALQAGPVCCETGHCNTCRFACMTKQQEA